MLAKKKVGSATIRNKKEGKVTSSELIKRTRIRHKSGLKNPRICLQNVSANC